MKSGAVLALIVLLRSAMLLAGEPAEAQAVEIKTSDGKTIGGKLYGKGETALVLCHGRAYLTGADSLADECRALAARGLACLAISFRGYPADEPPDLPDQELDVLAAFDYLAAQGAKSIYVLGASMGGLATLKALKKLSAKPQFAGIVIISAFYPRVCRGIGGRKLFVVSEDDRGLYPKVLATFVEAGTPKQAVVFETGGHGQELFKSHRDELLDLIALLAARPANQATDEP